MEKLYIVFDQIPSPESGGLVTTYINFLELMNDIYDIEIISIFNCNDQNKELFSNNKIHFISKQKIDIRFYRIINYIKQRKLNLVFHSVYSLVIYFTLIPFARTKMNKKIKESKVIVSCPSAAIFMSKKNKFILEIHTKYEYFWKGKFIAKLQIMLMRKPSLILFRNKADVKKSEKKYKVDYIYNFFDNKNLIVNNDYISKNKKIITIGRLSEEKDLGRMLDIAFELKKEVPNFHLDIYGTGNLKRVLDQKIIDLNLVNNVHLKGFTNNKNIYSKYALFWLTSKTEGFPLSVIEAKANAIPTITTNWGDAVKEVVHNGKDGYIISTNQEMVKRTLELFNDTDLLQFMSENALKDFNRFSVSKARTKWINILNEYK